MGADSIRWTRSASEGGAPRMPAVSRRLGNGVLIVTRGLMLFGHFPFQPVSHLMRVEPDRTANAEKRDSVVYKQGNSSEPHHPPHISPCGSSKSHALIRVSCCTLCQSTDS